MGIRPRSCWGSCGGEVAVGTGLTCADTQSKRFKMDIPARTGIYFVRLKGKDLAPIDRNPRRIDHCIRVNAQNCKFGQARNLRSRYRDYQRTFGADRIIFDVLVVCHNPDAVERRLKTLFLSHLIRGLTGRTNEWLHGIDPEQALHLAHNVCVQAETSHSLAIENTAKVLSGQDDAICGADIVAALEYLRAGCTQSTLYPAALK